jgi:aspartyl-tRNA(Asn)/glutamyl-tRNA(Gln) amidotransferase subunit C
LEKLTYEQVEHVAKLACLKLTNEEKQLFCRQLGDILEYVEQLNSLDTEGIDPTYHSVPMTNVFREDEPGESLEHELALANAPLREDSFFRIPKIMGE